MLTQLHIENIAVIERVDIDFDQGFRAPTSNQILISPTT